MTPCVLPEMIGVSAAKAYDWPDLSGIDCHLFGCRRWHCADRHRRLKATRTHVFRFHGTGKQELLPIDDVRIDTGRSDAILHACNKLVPRDRELGGGHMC